MSTDKIFLHLYAHVYLLFIAIHTPYMYTWSLWLHVSPGFKFNFCDSLLKLASGIIFYLLKLSANLLFHTYKYC